MRSGLLMSSKRVGYTNKEKTGKMIVQESLLKKLRMAFDLNIYEVKIWAALLSRGIASAGELADISGVPRSRSYDVLETLEKKGYVLMKLGKPIKYIAVKPEEVIRRVKKSLEDKALEQVKDLEKVHETPVYKEMELLYKQGIEKVEATDMSGLLKGRKNIQDHLKTLVGDAEKSLTIVTTHNGFIRKTDSLKTALKRAKERGVKIRIAAPIEANIVAEEIKNIAEVRKMVGQKARFVIADGKSVMFMLSNDEEVHEAYDLGVWINTTFFANALEQLFDMTWQNLKPIQ